MNNFAMHGSLHVPPSSSATATGNFFPNASGLSFTGGQTFIDIQNHNYPNTGAQVRDLLARESMLDAELHSRERFPQPKCLDGTRVEPISQVQHWVRGSAPSHELRSYAGSQAAWLYGPMGVGKSAFAQTLGLWVEENQRLGAAVFLSKSLGTDDPYRLFISIALQLAQGNGLYAERIAQQLLADSRSLAKLDLATQFKKLFTEPFRSITLSQKLLIIIDGLDELGRENEQREVIRLIGRSVTSLPLLWVLCTRPEPHIRQEIVHEFGTRCWWKEMHPSEDDIRLFLRVSLEEILRRYPLGPGEAWPPPEAINEMILAAAGLFIYASTLIKFIGDPEAANPKEQLEIVLDFIRKKSSRNYGQKHPLKALDELYVALLSRVAPAEPIILQKTLLLLGSVVFYPELPILELFNLLGLSGGDFNSLLNKMYAVVAVPPIDKAPQSHLRFYHSSFSDFLSDPSRSGKFTLDPVYIRRTFIEACFQALRKTKLQFAKELPWKTKEPDVLTVSHRVLSYAATHVWAACVGIDVDESAPLLGLITDFDFRRLIFVKSMISPSSLRMFAEWLSKQVFFSHLRTVTVSKFRQTRFHNHHSLVSWRNVDPKITGEVRDGQCCFVLGDGTKAITVYLDSTHLSILS